MNSTAMGPVGNFADPPWSGLVEQIRNGNSSALEQMYHIFSTGIRFYLCRQLGPQDQLPVYGKPWAGSNRRSRSTPLNCRAKISAARPFEICQAGGGGRRDHR
jgi:hypothetical protein